MRYRSGYGHIDKSNTMRSKIEGKTLESQDILHHNEDLVRCDVHVDL